MTNSEFRSEIKHLISIGLRWCDRYEDEGKGKPCVRKLLLDLQAEVERRAKAAKAIKSKSGPVILHDLSRVQFVDLLKLDRSGVSELIKDYVQ